MVCDENTVVEIVFPKLSKQQTVLKEIYENQKKSDLPFNLQDYDPYNVISCMSIISLRFTRNDLNKFDEQYYIPVSKEAVFLYLQLLVYCRQLL